MNSCQLCGYAGCLMPYYNQGQGTPASWQADCLQRQIVALREQVEAATVQPDSKPAAVDAQADAAELEKWRKVLVWRKESMDRSWSLRIVRNLMYAATGATLSYVQPRDGNCNCNWLVGRGGQPYPSRDAAMRAAEAALGLPKCRVEVEL